MSFKKGVSDFFTQVLKAWAKEREKSLDLGDVIYELSLTRTLLFLRMVSAAGVMGPLAASAMILA